MEYIKVRGEGGEMEYINTRTDDAEGSLKCIETGIRVLDNLEREHIKFLQDGTPEFI